MSLRRITSPFRRGSDYSRTSWSMAYYGRFMANNPQLNAFAYGADVKACGQGIKACEGEQMPPASFISHVLLSDNFYVLPCRWRICAQRAKVSRRGRTPEGTAGSSISCTCCVISLPQRRMNRRPLLSSALRKSPNSLLSDSGAGGSSSSMASARSCLSTPTCSRRPLTALILRTRL